MADQKTMTPTQAKVAGGALGGGALIAMAISLATPMVEKWEGTRTDPYRDIVGVMTVCTGETRVQMRRYTPAECKVMLDRTLAQDWAPAVLKAVPALKDRPHQLAASISLTYNIGGAAFARSSVARRFNAGDWRGGCERFLVFNKGRFKKPQPGKVCVKAENGGYLCVINGLDRRRRDERKLCLTGMK